MGNYHNKQNGLNFLYHLAQRSIPCGEVARRINKDADEGNLILTCLDGLTPAMDRRLWAAADQIEAERKDANKSNNPNLYY